MLGTALEALVWGCERAFRHKRGSLSLVCVCVLGPLHASSSGSVVHGGLCKYYLQPAKQRHRQNRVSEKKKSWNCGVIPVTLVRFYLLPSVQHTEPVMGKLLTLRSCAHVCCAHHHWSAAPLGSARLCSRVHRWAADLFIFDHLRCVNIDSPFFEQPLSMENLPKTKQDNSKVFVLERVFFFFSHSDPKTWIEGDRKSLFTARCPRLFVPACQRHDKPSAGSWAAVMDGGETDVYFGGEVWRNPLTIRCWGGEFREFLLQRFDKWLHFSNSDLLLKVISFFFLADGIFFFAIREMTFSGLFHLLFLLLQISL